MSSFALLFADLPDPRAANTRHSLLEVIFIALMAVLCGAESCTDMAEFGHAKRPLLQSLLKMPHGVSSHDTFSRVFRLLDPGAFEAAFARFTRTFAQALKGVALKGVVALDGKALRGAYLKGRRHNPLHLVNVWAAEARLVLGQQEAPGRNEVAGALNALALLRLSGCLVTADALHCRSDIAQAIRAQGGEYVLALKDNQPSLHDRVRLAFADARAAVGTTLPLADLVPHTTLGKGHGRIERRRCLAIDDPAYLSYVDPDGAWPGLRSVVLVESTRRIGDAVTTEERHYLSSLPADAQLLQRVIRGHWGIENRLHWALDVAFREDDSRVRADHAPENLAVIRHVALNLLRRDPSRRIGLANARFRAALDDAYLRSILDGVRA
jgi:predicted transposase YbfD/YdcC